MTTQQSHLSHPKYRPDIDGLRAIAVLSVVAFHAFPARMKGGFIGVDVFFVISGFLISTIIFENLEKGSFSFSEFYARRVKRIFPALIAVLAACLAFGWLALLPDELNELGKHVAAGAGFISNFVLWSEAGYFDGAAETKPLLHLWSLGIEEQFYIVWPLMLWLVWGRKFGPLVLIALVALVSFSLNVLFVKQDPVSVFYFPLTRFWELLCGALLAWYSFCRGNMPGFAKNAPDFLSDVFSFVGLLLLGCGFWIINKDLSFPGYWALMPVLGAVLIVLVGPRAWINRVILSNRVFVWFGLISFPLYLWHWPILSFGRITYSDVPPLRFRLIAVIASIAFAWITVRFIERPLRFGNGKSAFKVTALSVLIFSVAGIGFSLSRADFSGSRAFETLSIKRKGSEYAIGSSLAWYRGKGDWLFLGNAYDSTVAKLKLAVVPTESQIRDTKEIFSRNAAVAARYKVKFVLMVGPDKSSIYPEYLPDGLVPSPEKYDGFFLNALRQIPGLVVYDPTHDLLSLKDSSGLLYWMTDTHWNDKGAFLAYSGFSRELGLPLPSVTFRPGPAHSGDLVRISKLKNFPLHAEDNWSVVWKDQPVWVEKGVPNEKRPHLVTSLL